MNALRRDSLVKKISSLLLVGIIVGSTLVASAATTTSAKDPDDTRGRLDIRYVEFERSGSKATLTLRTAEKWRCRFLKDDTSTAQGASEAYDDGKAAFLLWSIGTDRNDGAEHSGHFRCKNNRLELQFDRPNEVSYSVRRPNLRTAKVTIPAKRFGLDHQRLRLFAISQLNGQFGEQTFFEERDQSPPLRPYKN